MSGGVVNTPKLRFPEFSGGWASSRMGDSFSSRRKRGENGLPLYSVTLDRGLVKRSELERKIQSDAADESNLRAQAGDLVYNMMRMWQGAVGRASESCMVSPAYVVLAPNRETDSRFFDFWFKSHRALYLLWAYSHGLTNDRLRLYPDDFSAIPHHRPKLPEQQKIAAFLGAVDAKIGQLTRKKALLEDYKKGCMQQLFTQKLRFKDDQGNDFPDWEEKKLGDVLTIGSGRDYKHLGAGNIPVYGTGGYMLSVDDYLYDGESVCIGRKGTIDSPALLNGKFWTVDTLFYTHSYQGVLPRFIFAIFQQINWAKYNEASGVPSLSKATIEQIAVGIPHPDEQRKIADFLSVIDAKISLVVDELSAAQNFKKGLLQQMFV